LGGLIVDTTIDYNEQMLNRYPEVIKSIREFQALINTESLDIKELHQELIKILHNNYLDTANEDKIAQWEELLGIVPTEQGDIDLETWLSYRRDTILARLYTTEKLNTKSISEIVSIFTGGTAVSYFKDGLVTVIVYPAESNKLYRFENVEKELASRIPAHLNFRVSRNHYTWLQVHDRYLTWRDIYNDFADWKEVLYINPTNVNIFTINEDGKMTFTDVVNLDYGEYALAYPVTATVKTYLRNDNWEGEWGEMELTLSGELGVTLGDMSNVSVWADKILMCRQQVLTNRSYCAERSIEAFGCHKSIVLL
jgi:hypothetical protein